MSRLNPRQRKFASEYIKNGFNGTQAVFAAGYRVGYNSACVQASRLLRNAKVLQKVEDNLKAAQMSATEVLERLAEIARQEARFSGSDVVKANELLGKGHKLFTDKLETEDKTPLSPDTLQTLRALAKQLSGQDLTDSQVKQLMADSFARAEQPIDGGSQ